MKSLKNGYGLALGIVGCSLVSWVVFAVSARLLGNGAYILAAGLVGVFLFGAKHFLDWLVTSTSGIPELETELASQRAASDAEIAKLRADAIEHFRKEGNAMRQRVFSKGYAAGRAEALGEQIRAYPDPNRVSIADGLNLGADDDAEDTEPVNKQ